MRDEMILDATQGRFGFEDHHCAARTTEAIRQDERASFRSDRHPSEVLRLVGLRIWRRRRRPFCRDVLERADSIAERRNQWQKSGPNVDHPSEARFAGAEIGEIEHFWHFAEKKA